MPQQIIIYRNPGEAAMWDLYMNSPNTFPVIIAIVAFFVGIVVCNHLLPPASFVRSNLYRHYRSTIVLIIAGLISISIGWWMWI